MRARRRDWGWTSARVLPNWWDGVFALTALILRRMPARADPAPSGPHSDRQVEFQGDNHRTPDFGNPFDAFAALRPAEMVVPIVAAWIEEANHCLRHRILHTNALAFAFIAHATGEPEVAPYGWSAFRLGLDVFDFKELPDD